MSTALGAIACVTALAAPAMAQEPSSGSITVKVRTSPALPADGGLQLLRNGTTNVWPQCGPGDDDTIVCSGLPTGEYRFATTIPGMTIAPDCEWEGINGSFYPIKLGSHLTEPRAAWNWNWNCTVWIGAPGIVVNDLGSVFGVEPAVVTFASGPPTCTPVPNDQTWCTAPSFGTWTIEPPAVVPDDMRQIVFCRPVGSYTPGAPMPTPSPVVTTTAGEPLWYCDVGYTSSSLRWSVIAEADSPDAALATAPWSLRDVSRGTDESERCSPVDALEPGELAAHRCDVDPGLYSLVIEGLESPYALHGCEEVYVTEETRCSVTDVIPTRFEYAITMWSAPSETWAETVRVTPVGPSGAAPECSTDLGERFEESGVVSRSLLVSCSRLLPGVYRSEVTGAPVAAERFGECDDVQLGRGSAASCQLEIRTVTEPSDRPVATLPPTGGNHSDATALAAAIAAATGVALLAITRSRRRPAGRRHDIASS